MEYDMIWVCPMIPWISCDGGNFSVKIMLKYQFTVQKPTKRGSIKKKNQGRDSKWKYIKYLNLKVENKKQKQNFSIKYVGLTLFVAWLKVYFKWLGMFTTPF